MCIRDHDTRDHIHACNVRANNTNNNTDNTDDTDNNNTNNNTNTTNNTNTNTNAIQFNETGVCASAVMVATFLMVPCVPHTHVMGFSPQWWPSASESSKSLNHVFPDEVELLPRPLCGGSALLRKERPCPRLLPVEFVAFAALPFACIAFSLKGRVAAAMLFVLRTVGYVVGKVGLPLESEQEIDVFFRLGMVALLKFMGFRVMSSIELTGTALSGSSDNDEDFDQFEAAASTGALSCGKAQEASEASEASYDEFSSPAVKRDKVKTSTWIKAL